MLRMNDTLMIGTALAALLAAGGCRSNDSHQRASEKTQEAADKAQIEVRQAEEKAQQARDKADVKASEAANAAAAEAENVRKDRDDYLAQANTKLNALDQRIAVLEARAKTHTDKATRDALENLRAMRVAANDALERAKASSKEGWSNARATSESVFDKAQNAFESLAARLHYDWKKLEEKSETPAMEKAEHEHGQK
jgi:hypothetical protein